MNSWSVETPDPVEPIAVVGSTQRVLDAPRAGRDGRAARRRASRLPRPARPLALRSTGLAPVQDRPRVEHDRAVFLEADPPGRPVERTSPPREPLPTVTSSTKIERVDRIDILLCRIISRLWI